MRYNIYITLLKLVNTMEMMFLQQLLHG